MNEEKILFNIQDSISEGQKGDLKEDRNYYDLVARISLYLLFLLVPLFFLPLTLQPVGLNKQILALVLALIGFIAWLLKSINSGKIIYPKTLVNFALLLFIFSLILSTVFSSSYIFSIQGQGGEPDTVLSFIIFILAFLLVSVFFTKQKDILRALLLFFAGLLILTIFNLFQIFNTFLLPFNFTEIAGFNPVGSANGLGFFLAFGAVILVCMIDAFSFNKYIKAAIFFLLAAIFLTLILINFWLIWLGIAVSMALIIILKYLKTRELIFSRFSLAVIILAASLILAFIRPPIATLTNLPLEVSPSYQGSFDIIKKSAKFPRIIFGSGPSSFSFEYGKYRSLVLNQTNFWDVRFNQAISAFLTNIVNLGILGTISVLFLFFSFIWTGLRVFLSMGGQKIKEGLFLSIFGGSLFLIISWFLYPSNFTLSLFTFLGMGTAISFLNTDGEGAKRREISLFVSPQRGLFLFLILIILTVFSAAVGYLTIQKYIGAIYFAKGMTIGEKSIDKRIEEVSRAVNFDNWRDNYLRNLSQLYLLKLNQLRNNVSDQEQFRNVVSTAVFLAQKATQINSAESLNWTNLGLVYENVIFNAQGADQFSQDAYLKALSLEPSNPRLLVDLSRAYLLSSDRAQVELNNLSSSDTKDREKESAFNQEFQSRLRQAKDTLSQAFSLKSDFTPTLFLMAQIAEREGNLKEAIQKISISKNLNPQDSTIAFQLGLLYYKDNQTSAAQLEFERAVALNENYSNARYFLGLIYEQRNQRTKALEQFEKIGALNPDNQEVKQIIDNLKNGKRALEGIVPPQQPPQERTETPVKE